MPRINKWKKAKGAEIYGEEIWGRYRDTTSQFQSRSTYKAISLTMYWKIPPFVKLYQRFIYFTQLIFVDITDLVRTMFQ